MPRDQAGTLHSSHNSTNVQNIGTERTDTRLQSVGTLSGWNQIQRYAGDPARCSSGGVLSLHLAIETFKDPIAAKTTTEHF